MFSHPIFIGILLISPLMACSSKSIIIMWLVIEIMTICFILIFSNFMQNSTEKFILYFVIQTVSSIILISFLLIVFSKFSEIKMINNSTIFLLMICLKMGLFPLHLWMLKIGKLLNWMSLFFILSWQKIIPIYLTLKILLNLKMIYIMFFSIMVGTLFQLSITLLKSIIILSSMAHSGWVLLTNHNNLMNFMYFLIYCLILFFLVFLMMMLNKWNFYFNLMNKNTYSFMIILSMGGIPPLMGFIPKWMILSCMIYMKMNLHMIILTIFMASISFYVYSQFLYFSSNLKWIDLKTPLQNLKEIKYFFFLNLMLPTLLFL